MSDNSGMSLGATSSGESRQQLIENRANANELQATLFKKGGYNCPTTTGTAQNNIMDKVCQGNASANQVNEGTKMGGKTKRKRTKRKKTKRIKLKKKSKRRK